MPYKNPDDKRAANAERMRRRRAEGTAWIDPAKEAERKARWYGEGGGHQKLNEARRQRTQAEREQQIKDFSRKLSDS